MANENGIDQTESTVENAVEMWCVDTGLKPSRGRQKSLESYAIEGDSPVVVTLKVLTGAPE